jgi:tRNA modification GTPase
VSLTEDDRVFLSFTEDKKGLIVINKIDLERAVDLDALGQVAKKKKLLMVSARQGQGVQDLKRSLREVILDADREPAFVLTNLRHKAALLRAEKVLAEAASALSQMGLTELVAVTLQQARESLEEIVGIVHTDDVLERIFSKFCLGK